MIKQIILSAVLAAIAACELFAVPAPRNLQTLTQPDGSTITVRMIGDERFHTFVTADDALPLARLDNGEFRYRLPDGSVSPVVAHDLGSRTAAEAAFIRDNSSRLSVEALYEAVRIEKPLRFNGPKASVAEKASAAQAPLAATFSDCPSLGTRKIPVIFAQYTDVKFSSLDPIDAFKTYFNEGSSSARQYFIDNSNGEYVPQFDLYGPVTLPNNRAYYGDNDRWGDDLRPGQMVADACTALDSQINFADYDTDGDGYVDAVIILYAGNGEQYTYNNIPEAIWPHKWELSSSDYRRTLNLDGVRINNYGCFNELYGTSATTTKIDGIGVFCHEFSHALGLPDLYGTSAASQNYYGMGYWSLMCDGCYNNNGYTPVGYSAYDKWFMGWIDLPEAVDNTHYTLPPFGIGLDDTDQALKITNPADNNEWFVVENRPRQGWYRYNDADGLLIYRVSYSQSIWRSNTVNNTTTGRYVPICADNKASIYNENGDLWPYGSNTALTNKSVPAMKGYNGYTVDRPLTEMQRNSDGTISFWFAKSDTDPSGIHDVATDESSTDSAARWYNLQGLEMNPSALTPGIYIRRTATTSEKIIIR